jgi:hypothetical protein
MASKYSPRSQGELRRGGAKLIWGEPKHPADRKKELPIKGSGAVGEINSFQLSGAEDPDLVVREQE